MTRDEYLAARNSVRAALRGAERVFDRRALADAERRLLRAVAAWERAELAWLAQETAGAPTLVWT